LDQELQKFKLELEADHAGITSKLEQCLTNKNSDTMFGMSNTSLNSSTSLAALNFSQTNNPDESDFTLCPSASTNDLVMMMLQQNNGSFEQSMLTPQTLNSAHKRKHSSNEKNYFFNSQHGALDEDSSSSWNSSSFNNQQSAVFHYSNRKGVSTNLSMSSNKQQTQVKKKNDNMGLMIKGHQIGHRPTQSLNKNKNTSTQKQRKKSRIADLDEDDDDVYEDEETRTSIGGEQYGAGGDDDENDDDDDDDDEENVEDDESDEEQEDDDESNRLYQTDESNSMQQVNEYDNLLTSDDEPHDTTNKMKMNKRCVNRQFNQSNKNDDSSEDTNERYCICKDVSYGDMIMCDNARCDTQWFHFVCVGLNAAPKGKWFCQRCADNLKKKRKEKQINSTSAVTTSNAFTRNFSSSNSNNDK